MMIRQPDHESDQNIIRWKVLLISLCLVMTFQIIRGFVTSLVYAFGERFGQTLAAAPAMIVFSLPILAAVVGSRLGQRRFLILTAGGLAILRLIMQISRDIDVNMLLAGLAIPLALMSLILLLASVRAGSSIQTGHLVVAIFLGMAIETGLHGAFLTWDYLWQPSWPPLLVALIISGLALTAVWKVQGHMPGQVFREHSFRDTFPTAGLGGFFMLEMLFFQNPAFIASSGLVPLEGGLAVVFIGNCLGLLVATIFSRQGLAVRLTYAAALVAVSALLPRINGAGLIAALLIGQAAAAWLLNSVLARLSDEPTYTGLWRTSLAVTAGSLLFIILTILYYISTLVTLPFSYTILPLAAAVLFSLAAFKATQQMRQLNWRLAALPLPLLLVPLVLHLSRPAVVAADSVSLSELRFINYNTHQGITFHGWLDPEGLARVIEAQKPDIVALQEISRGWLIAGALDQAEWLSRRLNMPYVYAPGHDYQFGNIIFTRLPITDWSFTRLPLLDVPLGRGLIQASIRLADGQTITVINTHLSAYASDQARVPQVQKVLETWAGRPHTIIAGDMNAHPEDSAIGLFQSAGLVSAQDVTGHSDLPTFSSGDPYERIDWVFGTPDMSFSDFGIPSTTASDHLPLVVILQLP